MPRPTPQELAKTFGVSPEKAREAATGLYGADAPEMTLPTEEQTAQNAATLPDGQPSSLLSFKDTMDKVVEIAKKSRNESTLGFMAPFQGTVAASDFGSILNNMNQASDTFSEKVLKSTLPEKLETQVVEIGGRKLLVNSQTGDTIKDLGVADNPNKGSGASSNQQTDNERALMGQFIANPIVKNYNDIVAQKNTIDGYIANGVGGPADLALVYAFMKGLDPNSVVRESEYATAAGSGNIFKGAFAKFNGYFKDEGGFLPDNVRKEFQNLVDQRLKAQTISYDNFAKSIKDIAKRQGMNPENVVPNFSAASSLNKTGGEIITAPDGTQVELID